VNHLVVIASEDLGEVFLRSNLHTHCPSIRGRGDGNIPDVVTLYKCYIKDA
jgi:hypothetical protein